MREDVSLLQSQGHSRAHRYPLARVWAEADTARRRMVNAVETDALVMQAVIGSALSKKGAAHLKALLKKLKDRAYGGAS